MERPHRWLRSALFVMLILTAAAVLAQEREPIAYVGHGGFFDEQGNQLAVTPEFVARAQEYYRGRLLAYVPDAKKAEFSKLERRVDEMKAEGQARFVVRQRLLDWLVANAELPREQWRMRGKLNALKTALQFKLQPNGAKEPARELEEFRLDPDIVRKLKDFDPGVIVYSATVNSGQAYINECSANGVPIPPPIGQLDPAGTAGWRRIGFIPTGDQFIVGTPAEVRSFVSSSPEGMCIALPRFTGSSLTQVQLDGVICLGRVTSKVCFWDNQMSGSGFTFNAGDRIPIGVPDPAIDPANRYQAGGAELEFGSGGVCTDCHAGENPYIIHPLSNLGGGTFMGSLAAPPFNLPMFAVNRYDPLVGASWPQNDRSHSMTLTPAVCSGCHRFGGAGRFPHLSSELPGYCGTILAQAVTRTMPPGSAGSLAADPTVTAFRAWCGSSPTSGPSDRGDPHLTTTNGIHYDFQAAGEFVTLRDSESRFELQTRQTPVSTTFTPGANAYTGLASCVSLNTAVAMRIGKHRVTYQPRGSTLTGADRLLLRIDGFPATLPAGGINLGGGNRVRRASSGDGLDVTTADGTHVIVTPEFWSSQGYWYLNVDVLDTPAREGTMGHILGANWLPLGSDGSSFGTAPASLADRHDLLNRKFADSWRVTKKTTLFDYDAGTSTDTFTNRDWPPPPGGSCVVPSSTPVREPIKTEVAQRLCRGIRDKGQFENCVFDVTVMGDPAVAKGYLRAQQLRDAAQ